jgi:hypothetical protein
MQQKEGRPGAAFQAVSQDFGSPCRHPKSGRSDFGGKKAWAGRAAKKERPPEGGLSDML